MYIYVIYCVMSQCVMGLLQRSGTSIDSPLHVWYTNHYRIMILLPSWHNVDKAIWLTLHAASLVFTFTGQQIPHRVTQLYNKSASMCQWTVMNVNCQQWAYLSHSVVPWYTTVSSNNNNGVIIHSYIMCLSKHASSKITPRWNFVVDTSGHQWIFAYADILLQCH